MFEKWSSTASIVPRIADHNRCQSVDYESWPVLRDRRNALVYRFPGKRLCKEYLLEWWFDFVPMSSFGNVWNGLGRRPIAIV